MLREFKCKGKHSGRVWTRKKNLIGWSWNVEDVLYRMDDQKRYVIGRIRQDYGTPGRWFGLMRLQVCGRVVWREVVVGKRSREIAIRALLREWAKLLSDSVIPYGLYLDGRAYRECDMGRHCDVDSK